MAITQKDKFEQLLKEKGKKKRDLATFLKIHENGINRLIANSNISKKRLEQIAEFLGIDVTVLLHILYSFEVGDQSEKNEYKLDVVNDSDINEEIILKLSEIIKGQKMISDLERQNGENITKIVNLLTKKL
jgi:plasmid maintenance system antidote protein VapI